MRNQSQKILSVILAAMTSMSPMMTCAAETEEIQSDIVETVTQQETTKKLNIDMNSGGVVILNPGFESEEKIKVSEKEGLKEFRIYDKDDVLIDVKDFEYTYETDVNSVININVSAEDGYDLKEFSINGEDVGFSVSQNEYSYAALIDDDKELKISFKERNKKENDVQDNAGTQITVNDSVNLRSPSPDVDGVFDSKCTSSNLRDGQPDCSGSDCLQQTFPDGKPGRGLPSIDGDLTVNSQKEAEKEEQKDDLTVNDTLILSQHTGLIQITERLYIKMAQWYRVIQMAIWAETLSLLLAIERVLQLRWQTEREIKQKQYTTLMQEREL